MVDLMSVDWFDECGLVDFSSFFLSSIVNNKYFLISRAEWLVVSGREKKRACHLFVLLFEEDMMEEDVMERE
jgi:hypothetical protein